MRQRKIDIYKLTNINTNQGHWPVYLHMILLEYSGPCPAHSANFAMLYFLPVLPNRVDLDNGRIH